MGTAWWQVEWVWEVTGWVLCALGVGVMGWALLWDRARGRRRCPGCWYDMSGTTLAESAPLCVCPECGRQIQVEGQMLRTRRRWKWVACAVLLLVIADEARSVARAGRTGWAAFVPGLVLLAFVPGDPPMPGPPQPGTRSDQLWWQEVYGRYANDDLVFKPMWPASRIALAWGAFRAVGKSTSSRTKYIAAFVLAQVDADAPARFEGSTRAMVVAACSDAVYATCSSYEDVGLHKGNIGVRAETVCFTAFRRPDRFRFEYLSGHPMQRKLTVRGVIWQDGAKPKMWWTIKPTVEESPDLRMPIASFTGVSSSTANTVPRRLLRQGYGGLGAAELLADEVFDGRECYRIREVSSFMTEVRWIDKRTFGILRIERAAPFNDVTVYRARFNEPSTEGAFTFDPSEPSRTPLGDGEKTCGELRGLLGKGREGGGK